MIALGEAIWLEASYLKNQSRAPWETWTQNRPNWLKDGEMYDRHTNRTYTPVLETMRAEFRRAAR